MSENDGVCSIDLIRWTFRTGDEARSAIETHLLDLGLDVMITGDGQFHVSWDEPDRDMDDLATEIWDLNGEPFEIVQEEFYRFSHLIISPAEGDESQAA